MRILHSLNSIKWSRNCWKICLISWESIKWELEKGSGNIKNSKDSIVRMTDRNKIVKDKNWKEERKLTFKKFNKMEKSNRDKINKDPCHHCRNLRHKKVNWLLLKDHNKSWDKDSKKDNLQEKRSKDPNDNNNKDKIFSKPNKTVKDKQRKVRNMKSNNKHHIARLPPVLQVRILMLANHLHNKKMFQHHIRMSAEEAKNMRFLLL